LKFTEVIVYQQNAIKAQAELAHFKGFASDTLNLLNPSRRNVSRQKPAKPIAIPIPDARGWTGVILDAVVVVDAGVFGPVILAGRHNQNQIPNPGLMEGGFTGSAR